MFVVLHRGKTGPEILRNSTNRFSPATFDDYHQAWLRAEILKGIIINVNKIGNITSDYMREVYYGGRVITNDGKHT